MIRKEIYGGCRIDSTIIETIAEAEAAGDTIEFKFNGVTVRVAGDSDAGLIERDWWRSLKREESQHFIVGPYPDQELTESEKAEDARLDEEIKQRQERSRLKYEAEEKAARSRLDAELATAPAFSIRDEAAWRETVAANSDGGYGECVIRFAENWARLMQERMGKGERLEDVASDLSYVASKPEGLTGFQYGAAVSTLALVWEHGERLRRWHNLKTQIKDEGERANKSGGVLNPAILTIG